MMVLLLLPLACHPKPVVVPGYFSAPRPANAPPTCDEVLACYARCAPPAEECMLLCEQCGVQREVARARAVSNCAAIKGCTDPECAEELCPSELATCKARHIGGPPVIDTFCPKQ
jgi:hypothetical protein